MILTVQVINQDLQDVCFTFHSFTHTTCSPLPLPVKKNSSYQWWKPLTSVLQVFSFSVAIQHPLCARLVFCQKMQEDSEEWFRLLQKLT